MKNIIIFFLLILSFDSIAQKINYTFPEGYENEISKKNYKYLVKESVKAISKNYKIVSVKKGVIELEKGQDFSLLNLHNLIVQCAQIDLENWSELINYHFDSMHESIEKQKQLDPNKFETLVDYLSVRIYPETYVTKNGDINKLVARTDLEGTYSLLVLDLPSTFATVQKEIFELWDKSIEEVFEIAQNNVNKQEFTEATELFDINGKEVEAHFIENENYGASLALDLMKNAPEFVGEWGSVIAFPNKGIVNICKISKDKPVDFVLFIQKFRPAVIQFFNQHPQPISTDFYWYYNNQFTKINIVDNNGELNVIAPFGLTELMSEKE